MKRFVCSEPEWPASAAGTQGLKAGRRDFLFWRAGSGWGGLPFPHPPRRTKPGHPLSVVRQRVPFFFEIGDNAMSAAKQDAEDAALQHLMRTRGLDREAASNLLYQGLFAGWFTGQDAAKADPELKRLCVRLKDTIGRGMEGPRVI